jgi:hypothetical protein
VLGEPPALPQRDVAVWADYLAPVARQMLPAIDAAVDRFAPDVIIVDQQAVAGGVVADRRGIPWAISATTSSEIELRHTKVPTHAIDPMLLGYLSKMASWFKRFFADLLVELGVDPARTDTFDPRFSPDLLIAYTTRELLGGCAAYPDHQLALLDRVAAVACHAGHNTVAETLGVGRPLVVSPIRDDQPMVAAQVVRSGAGVLVPYRRVTAAKLRAALDAVLDEPSYTTAAQRIQASFRTAGGPATAADRLEHLLARPAGHRGR